MGKRGGGFKLSRGGGTGISKLLQYGGRKIDLQTIYEWIVKMISMLFYGTKNQYRWRANESKN